MTIYTLTITERQAYALSSACEILARLGMGQTRDALERLPLAAERDYSRWHKTLEIVEHLLSEHTIGHVDGWRASLGIKSQDASEESRIAWDLYQVIRHRIAWDRAADEGLVNEDGSRNWPEMMGVNYDEPMQVSAEPLARMERT